MADLSLQGIRDLQRLILRVNGGADLATTLQAGDAGELEDLEHRLREAVSAPVDINGTLISLTMTIGDILIDPVGSNNPASLNDSADAAMYRLKP